MPNTKDLAISERVQAVVYARSGAGKTWGALTFPRPNFLDFDRGIATVKNPDFVRVYGHKHVEYQQFFERNTVRGGVVNTHNAFDDACKYFDTWMAPDKRDLFDTWVIDTGTTLSQIALNKAIVLLGSPDFGRLSKTHPQALKTGLVFPKIQDYGSERSLVEQFVQMVKDTDKHVLFLCHEKEILNDEGSVTQVVPLLTGKSSEVVSLMFDNVWNIRISRDGLLWKRSLVTQYDGIRSAKSRIGIPDGTPFEWPAIKSALDKIVSPAKPA